MTHAYAHAHFSNKRVIRQLRIVSCPGGGVWVAVTREFERDNCVISEILQSDWTIPNRAGVPRKSTKVPRPSFRVWAGRSGHETTAFVRESREGLGPRLSHQTLSQVGGVWEPYPAFCTSACAHPHNPMRVRKKNTVLEMEGIVDFHAFSTRTYTLKCNKMRDCTTCVYSVSIVTGQVRKGELLLSLAM